MSSNYAGFMLNFTNETKVIVETPEYFSKISDIVFNSRWVMTIRASCCAEPCNYNYFKYY